MDDPKPRATEVVITDFEMPFGSMVVFLIKVAFAAIPAMIVVVLGYAFIAMMLATLNVHK
jgi:hypothetical protein